MSTVFHNILRAADKRYARRFAVLGAVFLAVLLGSLLLGRYALSPGQLLHMLDKGHRRRGGLAPQRR